MPVERHTPPSAPARAEGRAAPAEAADSPSLPQAELPAHLHSRPLPREGGRGLPRAPIP